MNQLGYGAVICDAHDGIDLSRLGDPTRLIRTMVMSIEMTGGGEVIEKIVNEKLGVVPISSGHPPIFTYHNKHVVVIDYPFTGGVTLAWSYDDRELTFMRVVDAIDSAASA